MFHNKEWEDCGAKVMHRLAVEEQTFDGYWGEHTDNGPATGYNYLTLTGVALYYEHSGDPAALQALCARPIFTSTSRIPMARPWRRSMAVTATGPSVLGVTSGFRTLMTAAAMRNS